MIDFRYHLVSIVAVFLALSLGLLLGSTELKPYVQRGLNGLSKTEQHQIDTLLGQQGQLKGQISSENQFALANAPAMLHGVPDLATVHNGHITNYHKLRRQYEQRGYRFYTANDSEIIGVYLRDRLAAGLSIPDALRSSLDDFDGSFSYLAAWNGGLAYVKDRFGFKPLMVAETEDFVAIATEEIALRQALGRDFTASELAPGTMGKWNVSSSVGVRD